jgi:hypothetical protein
VADLVTTALNFDLGHKLVGNDLPEFLLFVAEFPGLAVDQIDGTESTKPEQVPKGAPP